MFIKKYVEIKYLRINQKTPPSCQIWDRGGCVSIFIHRSLRSTASIVPRQGRRHRGWRRLTL